MLTLTRRRLLTVGASTIAAPFISVGSSVREAWSASSCGVSETPNMNITPDYKKGSSQRNSFLEPGLSGERLVLKGRVITTLCEPVAGLRIEFWHADVTGKYDAVGYKLRGHQFTDKQGGYYLETIMPGYYSPLRHIHFLIEPPVQGLSLAKPMSAVVDFPETERDFIPSRLSMVPPSAVSKEAGTLVAPYDIVLH